MNGAGCLRTGWSEKRSRNGSRDADTRVLREEAADLGRAVVPNDDAWRSGGQQGGWTGSERR